MENESVSRKGSECCKDIATLVKIDSHIDIIITYKSSRYGKFFLNWILGRVRQRSATCTHAATLNKFHAHKWHLRLNSPNGYQNWDSIKWPYIIFRFLFCAMSYWYLCKELHFIVTYHFIANGDEQKYSLIKNQCIFARNRSQSIVLSRAPLRLFPPSFHSSSSFSIFSFYSVERRKRKMKHHPYVKATHERKKKHTNSMDGW